jgi:hypothetical protein
VEAVAARYAANQASTATFTVGYLIVDVCPGKRAILILSASFSAA